MRSFLSPPSSAKLISHVTKVNVRHANIIRIELSWLQSLQNKAGTVLHELQFAICLNYGKMKIYLVLSSPYFHRYYYSLVTCILFFCKTAIFTDNFALVTY